VPRAADETPKPEQKAAPSKTEADSAEKPKRPRRFQRQAGDPAGIAQSYLSAIDARDLDAAIAFWAPGGLERIAAIGELRAPDEVRAFFSELFTALPDSRFEVLDMISEGDQVVMRWRNTGTFCGGPLQGLEPTGARIDLEGVDLLTIEEGLIRHNDVYYDGTQFARQIGLLPAQDSAAERGITRAFNLRARLVRSLFGPRLERVADGVWLIRGGFPKKTMNVYLIEDDGGVTVFDAGIKAMTKGIAGAAATMGGVTRVVLGHSHADHRGAAPGLGAPVFCHPDEVADAEGDGGEHYFDYSQLERWFARAMLPRMIKSWDGGPVKIEGTLSEGDDVAGLKVIHLPGHAPGLIGLWRESDGLALVSDTLYTLDPQTGRYGPPRLPHRTFTQNTEQARASILKLAELGPSAVWPGHADPVVGDVVAQLRQAANSS
jgi:hydroxyacylglutathione hydrolase